MYILIDIGCCHVGFASKVIGVYGDYESAARAFVHEYEKLAGESLDMGAPSDGYYLTALLEGDGKPMEKDDTLVDSQSWLHGRRDLQLHYLHESKK